MIRHFVDLFDLSPDERPRPARPRPRAEARRPARAAAAATSSGRTLGLIFEKPSLRTRVSFEAAIAQLGGNAIFLRGEDVGLGSRESVADFARVISQYVDALAVRTFAHATVEELARHATVPIINALSDAAHPCQALADLMTIQEAFGGLDGHQARLRRRRQQRGAVAGAGLGPAGRASSSWPPRRATSSRPTSAPGSTRDVPRASRWSSSTTRARAVAGRRRRLHRRLGEHGPGARGRRAPRGLRAVSGQRGAAGHGPAATRSSCTACPPTAARK